jgi:maltose/moltooligosaccharide transporter
MGIFNFFIVIPEITASLGFGWVMGHLLNNNRISAVVAGGIFFMLAAVLTQRVEDLYDLRHPSGSLPGNAVAVKS